MERHESERAEQPQPAEQPDGSGRDRDRGALSSVPPDPLQGVKTGDLLRFQRGLYSHWAVYLGVRVLACRQHASCACARVPGAWPHWSHLCPYAMGEG
jgi:hypothetical protein